LFLKMITICAIASDSVSTLNLAVWLHVHFVLDSKLDFRLHMNRELTDHFDRACPFYLLDGTAVTL
jgi:hypothetical protein